MIVSKAKSSTVVSLSIAVALITATFTWILLDLIYYPEGFFLVKIILTPVLLVISILVLRKFYQILKTVKLGDNKVSVKYLFQKELLFKISDMNGWKEDVVKTKGGDFKQITFSYGKTQVKLSNRESTEFEAIRKYLSKKVKK